MSNHRSLLNRVTRLEGAAGQSRGPSAVAINVDGHGQDLAFLNGHWRPVPDATAMLSPTTKVYLNFDPRGV